MKLVLDNREIAALTRRDRPKAQARVLRALGIPFREHPTDAALLVSRTAAEAKLGTIMETISIPASLEYEVDLKAIREHGKTAPAR